MDVVSAAQVEAMGFRVRPVQNLGTKCLWIRTHDLVLVDSALTDEELEDCLDDLVNKLGEQLVSEVTA